MEGWLGVLVPWAASGPCPFGEQTALVRGVLHAARRQGLAGCAFTPGGVDVAEQRVRALVPEGRRWRRRECPLPGVVYDRVLRPGPGHFDLLRRLQRAGVALMTSPLGGKWQVHQVLAADWAVAPHLPETRLYRGPSSVREMLARHPCLYLKPVVGTGGRGIAVVRREGGGISFRLGSRDGGGGGHVPGPGKLPGALLARLRARPYLVQQGLPLTLPGGNPADLRVLVQKDRRGVWSVTGMAGRLGTQGAVTANLHTGGRAVPAAELAAMALPPGARAGALFAVAALALAVPPPLEQARGPLAELGLDVGLDPTGVPWLLEVNSRPQRQVFRDLGMREAWRTSLCRPAEYARFLLGG